jgi:hypothetical protein
VQQRVAPEGGLAADHRHLDHACSHHHGAADDDGRTAARKLVGLHR